VPAARSLRRWAAGAKAIFGGLAVLFLLLMLLNVFLLVAGLASVGFAVTFIAACVVSAAGAVCTLYWALSMRLAAALASAKLEAVAAAVRAAAAQRDELDAATWRATIAEPATDLARAVLPQLSRGWGRGLRAVGAGHLALAVGVGAYVFENRGMLDRGGVEAVGWVLRFVGFAALMGAPLALALAPAAVSTRCDELKDGLTMLHAKDLEGAAGRIDALYNFLDRVNNKQGIGFALGGGVSATVVDKKYLTQTAFTVYAVLGALVPTLLASLEEGAPIGGASPLCPYSWADRGRRPVLQAFRHRIDAVDAGGGILPGPRRQSRQHHHRDAGPACVVTVAKCRRG
jgi:hypothetical protein